MSEKSGSFNDLIDFCVNLNKGDESKESTEVQFRTVLSDYFFENESHENRKFEALFNEIEIPDSVKKSGSIFEINAEDLKEEIENGMINETLCGRIFLSPAYLKSFYKDHPPQYSKLPEDVKFEIMDIIKERNSAIVKAFIKMQDDIKADKQRTVSTLVALILRNMYHKLEKPFNKITAPAQEIISSLFVNSNQLFTANPVQMADLNDDSKIKQLIKKFFPVRDFNDLIEMSQLYKDELKKFTLRAERINK